MAQPLLFELCHPSLPESMGRFQCYEDSTSDILIKILQNWNIPPGHHRIIHKGRLVELSKLQHPIRMIEFAPLTQPTTQHIQIRLVYSECNNDLPRDASAVETALESLQDCQIAEPPPNDPRADEEDALETLCANMAKLGVAHTERLELEAHASLTHKCTQDLLHSQTNAKIIRSNYRDSLYPHELTPDPSLCIRTLTIRTYGPHYDPTQPFASPSPRPSAISAPYTQYVRLSIGAHVLPQPSCSHAGPHGTNTNTPFHLPLAADISSFKRCPRCVNLFLARYYTFARAALQRGLAASATATAPLRPIDNIRSLMRRLNTLNVAWARRPIVTAQSRGLAVQDYPTAFVAAMRVELREVWDAVDYRDGGEFRGAQPDWLANLNDADVRADLGSLVVAEELLGRGGGSF